MKLRSRAAIAFLLYLAAPFLAAAPQPGAASFFESPSFAQPQLSPNGRLLGALTRHDARHFGLAVIDLSSRTSSVIVKEAALSVTGYGWKTDSLLLIVVATDDGSHAVKAIDLVANKSIDLHRFNSEGAGAIVSLLPDDADGVLCAWGDGGLRRVDLRTGKATEVEPGQRGISRWVVDPSGVAWAGAGFRDEKWRFVWRTAPGAAWNLSEQPGVHDAGIFPLDVMPDQKRLVVIDRVSGGPARLAFFDLASRQLTAIFQDPKADVFSSLQWGFRREPCAAVSADDRQHPYFFHSEAQTCFDSLMAALPGSGLAFTSFSRDSQRALVRTTGTEDPGTYYLLDRTTGNLGFVGAGHPGLRAADISPTQPFQFTTRDGLTVSGALTLPRAGKNPPLVICIGPNLPGSRTGNRFDPAGQYLASRGFASARIDVRGTKGFGPDMCRAGDLQIGTGMADDLADAADWLAVQGFVDRNRIAVLGEGRGGLTAVHAAGRSKTFRALVNFDIPMSVRGSELRQLSPSDRDETELTEMIGGSAAALAYLASLDPLKAASRVQVPSFNAYRRQATANAMVEDGTTLERALRKAGSDFTMHMGLAPKPENDVTVEATRRFEALVEFLRKKL